MRISIRQLFLIALLLAAVLAAGARLAHAQGAVTNPTAIEFTSPDHTAVVSYNVCFYTSATATQPFRCNSVPVTQATVVNPTSGIYRLARSTWQNGLNNRTDYWPKVSAVGSLLASAEVAPLNAPFSFRLDPAPRLTDVTIVP